jgi:hypothetical protein
MVAAFRTRSKGFAPFDSKRIMEPVMPVIDADGCPLWVEVEGPQRAPVLMLSNSLGTNLHMWDAQPTPYADAV